MPLSSETIKAFQDAIRRLHGSESAYVESLPVREEFQGETIWSGIVHIFELEGHPTAKRAYVWAELMGDFGPRQRFFAVLEQGPIETPLDAVRASILSDYKEKEGKQDGG
jgi:hypothetical protein